MKKNLFKILLIILLFLPFFTFAAFELEYYYPKVPGPELTISAESTLGDVIKYFVSWAIIIGAIIAFLSLIYAGILYLSSTGRPEAMSQAKSRIFNSFLGLTILLGSYLILVTVNPQLIVMRVEKIPIVSGVVLLNSTSTDELSGLSDENAILATLEELINSKDAYSLKYDIKDCKEEFGELAVTKRKDPADPGSEATEVDFENFRNFTIGGIGFLKNAQGKAKVILYDQKDFEKNDYVYEFNSEGRIRPTGEIEKYGGGGAIKIINFPDGVIFNGKFDSKVKYANLNIKTFKSLSEEEKESVERETEKVKHPPLSIQVKNITPGVYLYSDRKGEETNALISSREDLRDIAFNDKAKRIEIKNKETTDYIAVLYEDPHWSGQLRIFFETKERYGGQIVGNTTPDDRVEITYLNKYAKIDQYGKVKKPSSIHVFELAEDPMVCSKVRLCTAPDFMGCCTSYTPTGETELDKEIWLTTSTLPIYIPNNIPITTEVKKLKEDGTTEATTTEFADNIRSIYIEGDCLVALFENSTSSESGKYWKGYKDTPGSHSQIFTKSVRDLSGYEIHKCRGMKGLLFWQSKSCASAIAIYPIKGFTFGGGEGGAGGAGGGF